MFGSTVFKCIFIIPAIKTERERGNEETKNQAVAKLRKAANSTFGITTINLCDDHHFFQSVNKDPFM